MKNERIVFSFIVPAYNRPDELRELLESFTRAECGELPYEIIIVDDGSSPPLEDAARPFTNRLPVRYVRKPNTGPGDSRNRGMREAKGEYFVILDSDVILPSEYLCRLEELFRSGALAPLGGGPDRASSRFPFFVRAVDLALTGLLTTGGIRGGKKRVGTYVPRSFNMIVKREVFERVGGFGPMHPGEDPAWVYEARRAGYATAFYPSLGVYHKRRTTPQAFWRQMVKFGTARTVLNRLYPEFASPVFLFPALYMAGLVLALALWAAGFPWLMTLYVLYWLAMWVSFAVKTRNPLLAWGGWAAFHLQMAGYALGLMRGWWKLKVKRQDVRRAFPELFFDRKIGATNKK
ncbi:MAG: glycosyltransferase [Chlorobi bacterium]|nr:glycosyltransferase [Chlorobiota bacterium]